MSASKSSKKPLRGRQTYWRLIRYARPYWLRLVIGTLCGILLGGSTAGLLTAARDVLGKVFQETDYMGLLILIGVLLSFGILRGLGQFFGDYFIEWVGNRVVMDLRQITFAHLQSLPVSFFSRSKIGELISRTLNDSMMIERAVSSVLGDLVKQPFVLLAAAIYTLYLDARLALAMLLLFPVCIIPVALFGRRVRRNARQGQERLADLLSIMQEALSGIRIVKAFGMEKHEINRFKMQCRQLFGRVMKVTRSKAAVEPLIVFISMLGLSLVLLYAHWASMPVENLVTFALAAVMMYEPVKKLSRIHMHVQQTSAAADRIFEILDTPVPVRQTHNLRQLQLPIDKIEFDNVGFAYEQDQPVLQDISFQLKGGERIALVGASGAGKTTLVNLLLRFYEVTAGKILLNGINLPDFRVEDLRRNIGLVSQDTFLFNDTIAANIAYGTRGASEAQIVEAAKNAYAHDFIAQMPEGYHTVIGDRGVRLSGGQCQRLAIARAILRDPPILILDEATSALDTESERLIQTALNNLMAGRTVFAIAHRLSTITHSDKIIFLEHGKIIESGPHDKLMAANGAYRRLYEMQFL